MQLSNLPAIPEVQFHPQEAPLTTHRFPIPRVREWFWMTIPGCLVLASGPLWLRGTRPSLEHVLVAGSVAVISGLIQAIRPRRAVVITPDVIAVPKGWSGTVTLQRSEVDAPASSRSSRWQALNGTRVIYGRDGTRVTLNSLALGRETVARILALVTVPPKGEKELE